MLNIHFYDKVNDYVRDKMKYKDLNFKILIESENYKEDSQLVVNRIIKILDERKAKNDNKVIINTNLRLGLSLENINKIAGSMVEAWAYEVSNGIRDDLNNPYDLKFISDNDINYNPALGTGQIQIKDIHYVTYQERKHGNFANY